jgi:hypothetical protein
VLGFFDLDPEQVEAARHVPHAQRPLDIARVAGCVGLLAGPHPVAVTGVEGVEPGQGDLEGVRVRRLRVRHWSPQQDRDEPALIIPIVSREAEPHNRHGVAKLGAEIALDGDSATPAEIADACRRTLAGGDRAKAARRLAEVIAGYPLSRAVDRLEAALAS